MGTTSQKLEYLNTTKGKFKDAINLTGANILSEDTFRSYADKLKQGLVDAINDGGSTIYSNFPKTTGEGTEIALNDTYEAPMEIGLKGNTHQDSYTGINLLAFPYYETTKTINGITFTVKDDGTIHVQGTASARAEFTIRNRDINLNITTGETYTLTTSGLGTVDSTLWLDTYGQSGNFLDKWALSSSNPYASAVAQSKDIKPLLRISVANGATVNTDVKLWLYKGAYDSSITYEPFVGGSPSPSPDYPQNIQVGTGNNTITISDGTNSENYSINLGSIELCKIPNTNYQDIIFHAINGDSFYDTLDNATKQTLTYGKWYKHSEIGKYVYNNDLQANGIDNQKVGFVTPVLNIEANLTQNVLSNLSYCNMLQTKMSNYTGLSGTSSQKRIRVYLSSNYATTYDEARAILSNGNLTLYYVLETPTNTEITDTDLISQLETIRTAKSVENKTNISQTNADLPFIIFASALSKN